MKVNTKELITILQSLKPGLTSKTVIEQTDCFAFQDKKVYTYNDEVAVSHPIPWDIEGAVPADTLLPLLSKINDEEIDITVTDQELLIKGNKFETGIALYQEIKIPIEQIGNPEGWEKIPGNFIKGLKMALFSVAKDMTNPVLACVHVNDVTVESCDKFRITQYTLDGSFPGTDQLFPNWAIKHLLNYSPIEFTTTEGWGHFRMEDGSVFSCRIFSDSFPDVSKHIQVDGTSLSLPEEVLGILERVTVVVKTDFEVDEIIDVSVKDGKIVISGKGPTGRFTERTRIAYKGDEINFKINPKFFAEILKVLKVMIVNEKTMSFKGEQFVHCISLV